ncbi:hypothetical protein DJ69_05780 [Halorubrum persicum]|uniref:Uncharacterized protein n=1 Tax=Halorubrum persicum TaxID=1383844 RepID=A0A2G1WKP5_9EURY|nr:hypothetical protein [Halorubrum persicum]PHQ39557.1 hypothetical protein DJ69_05780 [Halorubrum persicum]
MNLRDGATLGRAALRSVSYLLRGDIEFPEGRLQDTVETADGTTFVVYRETVRRSAGSDEAEGGAVLVFRMRVTDPAARGPFRTALFDPLANVATPFFAGLPGFRRKLWLAGEQPGEFLELYEWGSEADARRFVDALRSLIDPVDHAGTVEFDVVPHDSVEEYVESGQAAWREAPPEANRPPRRTAVFTGLAGIGVAIAAGYALRKRLRR